jgi:hypothetical protein
VFLPTPPRPELNDDGGVVGEQVTYMLSVPQEAGPAI